MIPRFSARFGWEHGWKSCMANSKDWKSENVNMIELICKLEEKVATPPPPYPPFSGLSPLSSQRICTPGADLELIWGCYTDFGDT